VAPTVLMLEATGAHHFHDTTGSYSFDAGTPTILMLDMLLQF